MKRLENFSNNTVINKYIFSGTQLYSTVVLNMSEGIQISGRQDSWYPWSLQLAKTGPRIYILCSQCPRQCHYAIHWAFARCQGYAGCLHAHTVSSAPVPGLYGRYHSASHFTGKENEAQEGPVQAKTSQPVRASTGTHTLVPAALMLVRLPSGEVRGAQGQVPERGPCSGVADAECYSVQQGLGTQVCSAIWEAS